MASEEFGYAPRHGRRTLNVQWVGDTLMGAADTQVAEPAQPQERALRPMGTDVVEEQARQHKSLAQRVEFQYNTLAGSMHPAPRW